MSITDQIEEKTGLKIDQLNAVEKETYFAMLDNVQKSQLTPDKLRDYIISMRVAVELELVKEPAFTRVFVFKVENPKVAQLQARLHCYILLETFLVSGERAKQQMEEAVAGMVQSKG